MFDTYLNDGCRKQVRTAVESDPNIMLDLLGYMLGIPEGAVAVALNPDMCAIAPAESFETVWHAMCGWDRVTLITTAPGAIIEVKGKLPKGKFGHGYYNIGDPANPIGGHLRIDELAVICFVSKPFMGLESHSVRLYNDEGKLMVAVYVGRDGRKLIPSVREGYMRLRAAVSGKEAR